MLILQGPDHPVQALTFSPDATTLYAVQGHHGIRAWNVTDRTATRVEYGGKLLIKQFVFYPGGRWAFSATAHTTPAEPVGGRLIDLTKGTMRPFGSGGYTLYNIAFFPNSSRFVTAGYAHLHGWTMTPAGPQHEWQRDFSSSGQMHFVLVAALRERFATAEIVWPPGANYDYTTSRVRVTIRRASDGEPVTELAFPHPHIQQLLASPNGELLVGRFGTELHVWNATDWNAPLVVAGCAPDDDGREFWRPPETSAAAFHPSGRHLLLANDDPSMIAFDTSTWQPVHRWTWDAGDLCACAVSPDGTLAATGGTRGTVVVWDLDL